MDVVPGEASKEPAVCIHEISSLNPRQLVGFYHS